MEMSINEVLVLTKMVRERVNELRALRGETSKKEHFFGNVEKEVVPQYDVKKVDVQIVELEKFLLTVDAQVKTSNAITKIDIKNYNVDALLKPIE